MNNSGSSISTKEVSYEMLCTCNRSHQAARGHATYVNVKIQTWPPVPKISYTIYGYTMFAHAQFTRASGCKSHSYVIKQIHGRLQPPFPYTAVANIRKTPPCLNLEIHVAIYGSYMPSRRLRWLDTPLVTLSSHLHAIKT